MKRVIIGGVVGGIVLYAWLALTWTVLPLHNDIQDLPGEAGVVAALREANAPAGTYFLPGKGDLKVMSEEYAAKHEAGPVGLFFYHPQGFRAMSGKNVAIAIPSDLIIGLMCAWLVWQARLTATSFAHRLGIVLVVGAIITLTTDIAMWNWMHFHTPWTIAMVIEHTVGALLMGIPVALIVKDTSGSAEQAAERTTPATPNRPGSDGGEGAGVPATPRDPQPAMSAAAEAEAEQART